MELEAHPVAGALGAVLTGLNLADDVGAERLEWLRGMLARYGVVFLHDQDLDLDDLERVTDHLGGRDVTPFVTPLPDRPFVIRVIKEPDDQLNFANARHSDLSYLAQPPAYTLLHAAEVPPYGGDTLWSNQYFAYDSLSRGLRKTLEGLRAVHSAGMAYGTGGYLDQVQSLTSMTIAPSPEAYEEQVHPVVTEHPVTHRAALYVNPVDTTRFEGWSPVESQPMLEYLYRQSTNENFTCRFHWTPGSLAIWDNRCTMHNALNDCRGASGDVPHERQGLGSDRHGSLAGTIRFLDAPTSAANTGSCSLGGGSEPVSSADRTDSTSRRPCSASSADTCCTAAMALSTR